MLKFKDEHHIRLVGEWGELVPRLKKIIEFLYLYIELKYNVDITITCLLRSQEEQDQIYGNEESYKKKPWKSVHQFFRGADIRTRGLSKNIIDDILFILNTIQYDDKRPEMKTAIYGNKRHKNHIHIQVKDERKKV